jgi:hypothetical protein
LWLALASTTFLLLGERLIESRFWKSPIFENVVAALVIVAVILYALWRVPRLQAMRSTVNFERENEARKTLATIIGGAVVVLGIFVSFNTLVLSTEGQITDRLTKAVEELGSQNLEIRIGGIYALERIARDSDRDYTTVLEILTAYVRNHAPRKATTVTPDSSSRRPPIRGKIVPDEPRMSADIQAILTVLGRRRYHDEWENIDLSNTDLHNANFSQLNFSGAIFDNSDLSGALTFQTDFHRAYLTHAKVAQANLNFLNITDADCSGTDFTGSSFTGADATGAEFQGANFKEANLEGFIMANADLRAALGLTDQQIVRTYGSKETRLPKNLGVPDMWHITEYWK